MNYIIILKYFNIFIILLKLLIYYNIKPPHECYISAKYTSNTFQSQRILHSLDQLKQCLIDGFSFVFAFVVFENFENEMTNRTGIMLMPKPGEKQLGSQAVCCVGF